MIAPKSTPAKANEIAYPHLKPCKASCKVIRRFVKIFDSYWVEDARLACAALESKEDERLSPCGLTGKNKC